MTRKFRTPRYEVYVVGSGTVVCRDLSRTKAERIAKKMTTKHTLVMARMQRFPLATPAIEASK